jgi:hypothetical protein
MRGGGGQGGTGKRHGGGWGGGGGGGKKKKKKEDNASRLTFPLFLFLSPSICFRPSFFFLFCFLSTQWKEIHPSSRDWTPEIQVTHECLTHWAMETCWLCPCYPCLLTSMIHSIMGKTLKICAGGSETKYINATFVHGSLSKMADGRFFPHVIPGRWASHAIRYRVNRLRPVIQCVIDFWVMRLDLTILIIFFDPR